MIISFYKLINLFLGAGSEDVALCLDEGSFGGGVPRACSGESDDRARLQLVVFQGLDVDSVLVVQISVVLGDTDALSSLKIRFRRGS